MKGKHSLILGSLLFVCISQFCEAARLPVLRYRFLVGQTNIYKVEIEVRGENGTSTLAGNIFVTAKLTPSNILCLGLRGLLASRYEAANPASSASWNGRIWPSTVSLGANTEIRIDERGHLLRLSGDFPLPIPLGSVAQLFIQPLPSASESRWEISEELAVLEPMNLGPALSFISFDAHQYGSTPAYDSRNNLGLLPVARKLRCEIKAEPSPVGQIVISNHFTLDSRLSFEVSPYISASGDGEVLWDAEFGFLRNLHMAYKTIFNSENVTRRFTATAQVTLLEGTNRQSVLDQIAASVNVMPNQPAPTLTSDDVNTVIKALKSKAPSDRYVIAYKLRVSQITNVSPEVIESALSLLSDEDSAVREIIGQVVADHGTSQDVPALLKMLKGNDARWAAIRGLGRLKDQRAIEPLVMLIARGEPDSSTAGEALAQIGAIAEDAVLPLLQEKNVETRRIGCRVLSKIGTSKSLNPLRELMLDPNPSLNSSAAEAVRQIAVRQ